MYHRALCVAAALAANLWISPDMALAKNRAGDRYSAYEKVGALHNPQNDANAMAQLLNRAGFEIMLAQDLAQADMRQIVSEFVVRVANKGPPSALTGNHLGSRGFNSAPDGPRIKLPASNLSNFPTINRGLTPSVRSFSGGFSTQQGGSGPSPIR
jgi:hypothetical protein